VFSAIQVTHGKPAPDLFLFAAERLGAAPEDCIVVEDSIPGVEAAVAARMPVVGFCGGGHCPNGHGDRLIGAGCSQVFDRMTDLAVFLREE
jgi:beta-phosphoglucomutase-like phosphatase (HAD superfamily)